MRDELTSVFEAGNAISSPQEDLISFDTGTQDNAPTSTIPRALRDAELSSPQMQGLKRASIAFFNAWRTKVLRRIGTVLSVQPEAIKRAKARFQTNQETTMRAKRDKEYFDWANGEDAQRGQKPGLEQIRTSLNQLDKDKRALILNCCLMLLLSLEQYPAHSRILLERLAFHLDLASDTLPLAESTVAQGLLESAAASSADADEVTRKKAAEDATARRWKVGLATVAGAAVVGVTGGLAAPFLLASAGAIMGGVGLGGLASLLGALVGNPVVIGALFGAFGGKITGKAMDEYAKEVKDFKLIPLDEISLPPPPDPNTPRPPPASIPNPTHKLRLSIGISGYLLPDSPSSSPVPSSDPRPSPATSTHDITTPWRIFSSRTTSPFALRYDPPVLLRLGSTIDTLLRNTAYSLAQASFLQVALPAVISSALLPVSLIKLGSTIDNPFSVAMERSDKAGKVLAAALMAKVQGERPVSLIGYSLGARVTYVCLQELAARQALGLVENVVLMGAPAPSDEIAWRRLRSVVVGRIVNIYTTSDLLLGFLYRSTKAQVGVAGLQAIEGVPGVENLDATGFVKGHHQWRVAVGRALRECEWMDLDLKAVQEEEEELRREDEMEEAVFRRAKAEGRLVDREKEGGGIVMIDAEVKKKQPKKKPKSPSPHPSTSASSPAADESGQHQQQHPHQSPPPYSPSSAPAPATTPPTSQLSNLTLHDPSPPSSPQPQKIELRDDLSDDDDDGPEFSTMAYLDPTPHDERDDFEYGAPPERLRIRR
ncbi:MAG: hypothetical protein Q9160_004273 [Pyrenula sp. 1 TL-2023]